MTAAGERSGRLFAHSSAERRTRFGLLLLAISAAFAVQGITDEGRWQELVVSVLLATTLVLAVWVAEPRPSLLRGTAVVASALVALSVIEALTGHGTGLVPGVANLLLVTMAPPAIVVGIIRTFRARNQVTVEALFGVLSVYLLLGMFFAFVYGVIGHVDGTFFAQDVQGTVPRYLYFSFITLTTVGYGDLTAASNLGHTLSASEALLGQVYLVTVVSVIVANLGRARASGDTAEER
jgi:hypothetical protein